MVLRKSFYIRWSAGRSPRVHEVNPGRDLSTIYFRNICCICNNVFSGLYGYVTFFNLIKNKKYVTTFGIQI